MQVTPSGNYLYALDDESSLGAMYGYAISGTGLTSVSGSPYLINPSLVESQFAIDASSSFLFAANTASVGAPIGAWSIGAGGALTPLSETVQSPSTSASAISTDPTGNFVYVDYGPASEIWTYGMAQSGSGRGTLTAVNRIRTRSGSINNVQLLSTGSAPVTFTPQALYVTNSISNSVSQFQIAPATGVLSSLGLPFTGGSGAAIGSQPEGVAVLPNGSLLYNGDFGIGQIDSFSVTANGALTSSGLQPVVVPAQATASLATDLSGSFLYMANQLGGNIGELPIGSGGKLGITLTTTSTVPGSAPVYVTTDPTGQFIYSANSGTDTIGEYRIVLPTGTLSSIATALNSQGTGPAWIAIDPTGRFAYAANQTTSTGGTVGEFTIAPATGALADNSPAFINAATAPSSAVVEPTGKFLFVSDFTLNQISSFTIDPSTGALGVNAAALPAVSTGGTGAVALGVDVSGQYLYCVNSGSNDISIFKINLSNGTLSQVGTATVPTGGTTPIGLAITGTLQ